MQEQQYQQVNEQIKLQYRLITSSSEDPEHSLFEITKGMKGKGWVSARFCSYPQEIIIQFYQPVNIRQINVIIHEKKIPCIIEFFSCYYIDNSNNIHNNNSFTNLKSSFNKLPHYSNYEKIGFIKLSTNIQSNYKAREYRKIFLNTNAYFFKLQFQRNYSNQFNLFNQVGLFCLEFYGHKLKHSHIYKPNEEQKQQDLSTNIVIIEENEEDDIIDQICNDKLKTLNDKMKGALLSEDYEECKLIKQTINRIKGIGRKIDLLEKQKQKMVEYEDYEGARLSKGEIDKLKIELKSLDKRHSQLITSTDIGNYVQEESNKHFITEQIVDTTINNNKYNNINDKSLIQITNPYEKRDSNISIISLNNNSNADLSSLITELPNQCKRPRNEIKTTLHNNNYNNNIFYSQKNIFHENDLISHDDVILPTIVKKLNPNQSHQIPQETGTADKGELEELPNKIYNKYELLIPYIGEEGLRKVFSKQILWKEEGFENLVNKIENIFNEQTTIDKINEYIIKLMKMVIIFLDEKHPSIIVKTLELFEKLLKCIKKQSSQLNLEYDFNITDAILDKIKQKLGDVSPKVRNKAVNLYFYMLQQDFCDYNNLLTELLEEEIKRYELTNNLTINSTVNKKQRATTKLTLGKLQIFNKVIDDVDNAFAKKQTSIEKFPYEILAEYLIIYVDHNRSEIRKLTRMCIGKFINKFGFDRIKKYLEKVDIRELNKLLNELPQYANEINEIINTNDITKNNMTNLINYNSSKNINIKSLNIMNSSNVLMSNRGSISTVGKTKFTIGLKMMNKKIYKSSSMSLLPLQKQKMKLKPIVNKFKKQ